MIYAGRVDGESDWVEGVLGTDITFLRDVAFSRRPYRQPSQTWDHDHCTSCMAKFSERGPDDLREGWTTTDEYVRGAEYEWLCDECFALFRERLGLREVEDSRPVREVGSAPETAGSDLKRPTLADD